MFEQITIIGVGLLGGSLGKAIKEKKIARKVVGIVRRKQSIKEVLSYKACDEVTLNIASGVKDADLIIIATPVGKIVPMVESILPHLKPNTIITDVGSVKEAIVDLAQEKCQGKALFIGSHPIAGSEKRGVNASSADLFKNTVCIVTPTKKSDKTALEKVISFWKKVNASVEILTVKEHDKVMAAASHLPHLIAATLVNSVFKQKKKKIEKFVGGGFKDTTRIASSSSKIWLDIFQSNQKEVLASLEIFKREIEKTINSLKHHKWQRLNSLLKNAKTSRDKVK